MPPLRWMWLFDQFTVPDCADNPRAQRRGRIVPGSENVMRNAQVTLAASLAIAACIAAPAAADEVSDFYKGKSINVVVGHEPATGFDIYARVLARHLSRHIPGNPTIVVQNMLGASGLVAANWL